MDWVTALGILAKYLTLWSEVSASGVNNLPKRWASPFADAPFQTPKVCLPHVALHHSTNPWRIPVSMSYQIEILSPPWAIAMMFLIFHFFHVARSVAIFHLHVASLIFVCSHRILPVSFCIHLTPFCLQPSQITFQLRNPPCGLEHLVTWNLQAHFTVREWCTKCCQEFPDFFWKFGHGWDEKLMWWWQTPRLIILRSWPNANWDFVDHGGEYMERYD